MRAVCLTILSMSAMCLLQTGCANDYRAELTAPSLTTKALREARTAENAAARPFKGQCDVDAVFETETQLRITGRCLLTHLGVATIEITQSISPGVDAIPFVNEATYTAANGDKLYSSTIGTATPNTFGLALTGNETFTGGTGRFVNARGESRLTGQVVFTGVATAAAVLRNEGALFF